jgi:hypothetical protein
MNAKLFPDYLAFQSLLQQHIARMIFSLDLKASFSSDEQPPQEIVGVEKMPENVNSEN